MNILDRLKYASENKKPYMDKSITSCGGCQSRWYEKVLDFGETLKDISVYIAQMSVGSKVSQEEHDRRKSICETCMECDRSGERLYREIKPGIMSCGIPRTQKYFRLSEEDGCGCWLNLKWWGNGQKCPLKNFRW